MYITSMCQQHGQRSEEQAPRFPRTVRKRMPSAGSMALSACLSREARTNLRRLVLSGSVPRWAFVSSASPRRDSHEPWETRLNVSLSEKRIPQVSQQDTFFKRRPPRQSDTNRQNPAWKSYLGRASRSRAVWKEGAFVRHKIETDTKGP